MVRASHNRLTSEESRCSSTHRKRIIESSLPHNILPSDADYPAVTGFDALPVQDSNAFKTGEFLVGAAVTDGRENRVSELFADRGGFRASAGHV